MEKELAADKFIITKTDPKGVITYANAAFLDIVGAGESQLYGKPHSIIRHPDMPRCVFRYFWEQISQKKEIFAFVKNATYDKSGYYWVFANTSPSFSPSGELIGYYSVRRRISPAAKAAIAPLYAQMKAAEQAGNMDAGWKILQDLCKQKNCTYEELILGLQG